MSLLRIATQLTPMQQQYDGNKKLVSISDSCEGTPQKKISRYIVLSV